MAIFKIINENYPTTSDMENLISYVIRPNKALYVGIPNLYAMQPNPASDICTQMLQVKNLYSKNSGKQLIHFVISLSGYSFDYESRMTPEQLHFISSLFANDICEAGYQCLYAIHKTSNLHVHFVLNSVNWKTGEKFSGKQEEYTSFINGFHNCALFKKYQLNFSVYYGNAHT